MSERVKLKLKYTKWEQNIYNPQYAMFYFEDSESNEYIWSFKEPPKSFIDDFNFTIGEEVDLTARVEGKVLKYVKFS